MNLIFFHSHTSTIWEGGKEGFIRFMKSLQFEKGFFLRRSREVELLDNKLVEGFLDRLSFIHSFMM